jgi:hypothetical protein
MNAISGVPPKAKRRQSVGSQILVIILLSVLAGSHLEKASLRYFVPRQPYEWTGELITGIGFLIAVIPLALRLRREATSMPQDAHEPPG